MKRRLTFVAPTVVGSASENPFYPPIRNNDLAALRQLIRDPGPQVRVWRRLKPLTAAASITCCARKKKADSGMS